MTVRCCLCLTYCEYVSWVSSSLTSGFLVHLFSKSADLWSPSRLLYRSPDGIPPVFSVFTELLSGFHALMTDIGCLVSLS